MMTKTEITHRLLQQSQNLPVDILQKVLEFMVSKRKQATKTTTVADWKHDFLAISQWDKEQEVKIKSKSMIC